MDVFKKHQLIIAKKTLKMTDSAVMIMGGMTKEEAKEIIKSGGKQNGSHENQNAPKKSKQEKGEDSKSFEEEEQK